MGFEEVKAVLQNSDRGVLVDSAFGDCEYSWVADLDEDADIDSLREDYTIAVDDGGAPVGYVVAEGYMGRDGFVIAFCKDLDLTDLTPGQHRELRMVGRSVRTEENSSTEYNYALHGYHHG